MAVFGCFKTASIHLCLSVHLVPDRATFCILLNVASVCVSYRNLFLFNGSFLLSLIIFLFISLDAVFL